MGPRAVKLIAVAVLLVSIGSHVSELLDSWDNTFQTGNDVESVVVILALTVGSVLALASVAKLVVVTMRFFTVAATASRLQQPISELIVSTHSPPLIPLRI